MPCLWCGWAGGLGSGAGKAAVAPAHLSQSCRKGSTASAPPHSTCFSSLPSPWLLLPEFSPLASSQVSTWQVNEGSVSHSFLENRGLDKLPEGRGQSNWLLQEPCPGWAVQARDVPLEERWGPTGSSWGWDLVSGCASSQCRSVLCFQGARPGLGRARPRNRFLT